MQPCSSSPFFILFRHSLVGLLVEISSNQYPMMTFLISYFFLLNFCDINIKLHKYFIFLRTKFYLHSNKQ